MAFAQHSKNEETTPDVYRAGAAHLPYTQGHHLYCTVPYSQERCLELYVNMCGYMYSPFTAHAKSYDGCETRHKQSITGAHESKPDHCMHIDQF